MGHTLSNWPHIINAQAMVQSTAIMKLMICTIIIIFFFIHIFMPYQMKR